MRLKNLLAEHNGIHSYILLAIGVIVSLADLRSCCVFVSVASKVSVI